MPNIKGFAIRGLLRYLKENRAGAAAGIIAKLSPQAQKVFERPIVASNMYPYEAFAELLRGIDQEMGRGDLKKCEEIGDFAARQDINGMFKMMMSVFSPKTIVERSNLFWAKYCDTGTMVAVSSDAHNSVMQLRDFPQMNEAHCMLMMGWIRRWALMTKAKTVTVRHSVCVNKGGPFCQWDGHWT